VGERRESAVAVRLLADDPAWKGSVVVSALADGARALVTEADVAATLAPTRELDFPEPGVASAVADLLAGGG